MFSTRLKVSKENLWAWGLVALAAIYAVFPHLFRQTEFAHMDIVYNYGPIRSWFADQIRQGTFPLWDPYMGLGRFAEAWTSIPVDILTLLEVPFHLGFRALYVLQILVVFVSLRLVLARLKLSPLETALATLFYLLAPITSYFLRYYVKGWLFLLYGILFTFLFLFVKERKRSHLYWIVLATWIFSLGGKFEYVVTLSLSVTLAYCLFVAMSVEKNRRWSVAATGLAAFICPLLLNFWSFNLVIHAAQATLRLSHAPVVWPDFFRSVGYGLIDPHFAGLLLVGLVLLVECRSVSRGAGRLALAVASVAAVGFGVQNFHFSYGAGITLALALYLVRGPGNSLEDRILLLAKAAILYFYFNRSVPGDVDEMKIIHWFSGLNRALLGAFCAAGLFSKKRDALVHWSMVLVGVVFFYRSLGLVVLNHMAGILWLPARDNFLIELPFALFMSHGFVVLVGDWMRFSPRFAWSAATLFVVLFLQSHPFLNKPVRIEFDGITPHLKWKTEQFSDQLQKEMELWRDGFEFESFGGVRVLSYFHSFGRKFGVADAREYQSLVSGRFARYSIAGRLGLDPSEIRDVTSTTLGLSERFRRLTRSVQTVESIARDPALQARFYRYYVLSAVPVLNCDHLRLLGVRYLESDFGKYYGLNSSLLSGTYSLGQDPPEGTVAPDVEAKVEACHFMSKNIGPRRFWVTPNPLPRAYFLPGVSAQNLARLSLDDLKVEGDTVRIEGGEPIPWHGVEIVGYHPNDVEVRVNTSVAGAVVLSDLYHEQWKASLNGRPVTIEPAFSLVRAVDVQAGQGLLRFELPYPNGPSVIFLSLLGLAGLIGLAFIPGRPIIDATHKMV